MLRSVWLKTVRDGRRALAWWAVGVALFVLVNVAFYPSIKGNQDYDELLQDYPEFVQTLFGKDLTSPAGYLYSQLFSLMVPLLLMIYVVGGGSRAIAGEEEAGTLDLLLAQPVSRTRLVLEKAAAIAVLTALLALAFLVTLVVSARPFSLDIGVDKLVAAVAASYLLALVYGFVALLVGAATGSRGRAIGIPVVLAIAAYFLNAIGQVADPIEPWRVLSPFEHVGDPLREGFGWGMVVLALLAAAAAALAPVFFTRRDVAV